MAERLKDIFFTRESMTAFARSIEKIFPKFDKRKFLDLVYDGTFETKEFMAKSRHTTECLYKTLPQSYSLAVEIIKEAALLVKSAEALSFPDYVAQYGMDDWDLSLPALAHITKYVTAELAIRSFLDKDPDRVMACMIDWAEDKNPKLRRLASEGSRPRLPWAMALPKFKKDPSPILPVLEKLKNDPSEDVRRSVANNLNDISKDNPDVVLDICEKWYGQTLETNKIVKHACRSLLKAGDKRALRIFGYSDPSGITVANFKIDKKVLDIGSTLNFSFELVLKEASRIRLEYAVFYVKAKGQLSKKIFQIIDKDYAPGKYSLKRKQFFGDQSTRQHFPGTHHISIIVNGEEKAKAYFDLKRT